jgi:cytochrome c oxidase assembly factor 6
MLKSVMASSAVSTSPGQPPANEKSNFPTKAERAKCWAARDEYWACLDKEGVDGPCEQLRSLFQESCPTQWVKHFDRRYKYLKFKEKMVTEGFDPVDENAGTQKGAGKEQQQTS